MVNTSVCMAFNVTHACTHTHKSMCKPTYSHTHTHTCMHAHTQTYIYLHTWSCACTPTWIYALVQSCIQICEYIIHIHTYECTHRHSHTFTQKHTNINTYTTHTHTQDTNTLHPPPPSRQRPYLIPHGDVLLLHASQLRLVGGQLPWPFRQLLHALLVVTLKRRQLDTRLVGHLLALHQLRRQQKVKMTTSLGWESTPVTRHWIDANTVSTWKTGNIHIQLSQFFLCFCACVCECVHVCVRACVCAWACGGGCVRVWGRVRACVMHAYMHAGMCMHFCVCMCASEWMCARMCDCALQVSYPERSGVALCL